MVEAGNRLGKSDASFKAILLEKIKHWESQDTKKSRKYASHYRWILKRMDDDGSD